MKGCASGIALKKWLKIIQAWHFTGITRIRVAFYLTMSSFKTRCHGIIVNCCKDNSWISLSSLSLQYHCMFKTTGHEDEGNDHKRLTFKQILPTFAISIQRSDKRTSILVLGLKGLSYLDNFFLLEKRRLFAIFLTRLLST